MGVSASNGPFEDSPSGPGVGVEVASGGRVRSGVGVGVGLKNAPVGSMLPTDLEQVGMSSETAVTRAIRPSCHIC